MAGSSASSSAVRFLQLELKKIHSEPVEGFRVFLPDDSNIFVWDVAIFGPPDTLYQGGYFKAQMKFPQDYPYSPPKFNFLTRMWHPNIYENGEVCISILHPPTDDPLSGELPSERWNPTQNVRTILLSIISLLNEPNTSSPANVDASVSFRKWKEGKSKDYELKVRLEVIRRKQVLQTKLDAEKDGVEVPVTVSEYCISSGPSNSTAHDCLSEMDFYDEDCVEDYDDDDDDDEEDDENDGCDGANNDDGGSRRLGSSGSCIQRDPNGGEDSGNNSDS
ncbi:hypothetical protein HELRODRAFT_71946 [Helobdella robusta]|uniref:UBC core domain-containing protein n=1 Tax=Helobdella robusta TaxID=6412 RepID=T1G0T3_HELRO|nr:hypothetical protein HELRODRAFT_71946 [Helobdella robusta]ESO10838.1 hypothetical protein HELRODRAFT_71946 [Helobdella robusta]